MSGGNSSKIEYKIMTGGSHEALERFIQDYINEGWELAGGVNYDGIRYIQAMTKRWVLK